MFPIDNLFLIQDLLQLIVNEKVLGGHSFLIILTKTLSCDKVLTIVFNLCIHTGLYKQCSTNYGTV